MDKVTVFGAGHVGATTAFYLAHRRDLDISMVDIDGGKARGLALDIEQSLSYPGSRSTVSGSADAGEVSGSDLVVITAGTPRKRGMSRLDLTSVNAEVVEPIARGVAESAPNAVVVVVTNPVDEMTYLAWSATGFPHRRVVGMAGVLDTSRFMNFLRNVTGVAATDMEAMVLGTHGDDMVPLLDSSVLGDRPLSTALDGADLESVVERTRNAGAEIVGHLKTGSAYFAPAVAIGLMVDAILGDGGDVLPVSTYLDGEYGIRGVFLGVPARLDRSGVVEVVELELSDREIRMLERASEGVLERVLSIRRDRQ
jgi:malate dehydrogenase